jgi:hypothetical protein
MPKKKNICAPRFLTGETGAMACFDRKALIRIIDGFNREYPQRKVSFNRSHATKSQLWNLIKTNMIAVCDRGSSDSEAELCWLDQPFISQNPSLKKYLETYFRPKKPEGKYQWLSTTDIDNVLTQYEKVWKDFVLLGPTPIDFQQINSEISRMNFCRLVNKGKYRFGFVFNLDPHDQPGSHWVAMMLDLTASQPYIGYFDSYGNCPPSLNITKLILQLQQQVRDCLDIELVKKCNKVRHQYQNSECGVYCIYFIYHLLLGYSFEEITGSPIDDQQMNRWRDYFFR